MYIDQLKVVLMESARKNLTISYCLWGPHGIGKTQVPEQVAKELGYRIRNFRLSQVDSSEIIGWPTKREKAVEYFSNGEKKVKMVQYLTYDPPEWFIDAANGGNFILFFDELNHAKQDSVDAIFELVQERKLNGIPLPDSVLILAANNPPNALYPGAKPIFDNQALLSRFCHINVDSKFEIWKEWARREKSDGVPNIEPEIVEFLAQDTSRNTFHYKPQENEASPFADLKPAPRNWEKVNEVYTKLNLNDMIKLELYEGLVGVEAAAGFVAWLAQPKKPISLAEVFEWSEATMERVKDLCGSTSSSNKKTIETGILKETCDQILGCQTPKELDELEKNYENVLNFLSAIPAELSLNVMQQLCVRGNRDRTNFWKRAFAEDAPAGPDGKLEMVDEIDDHGNVIIVEKDGKKFKKQVPKKKFQSLHDSFMEMFNARKAVQQGKTEDGKN